MVGRFVELMLFGLGPLLLGIIALPAGVSAEEKVLSGEVFYRERIALPPQAELTVELADVSLADAPAAILGKAKVVPAGQVPVKFEIRFDPSVIRPAMSYALQARITVDGVLWFTTAERHEVKPLEAGAQTIMLQKVSATDAASGPSGKWVLEKLDGQAPAAGSEITLSWEPNGRIAGSAGCNRYSAGVRVKDEALEIGQAISTQMACAEPVMAQEHRFLQALGDAAAWREESGSLVILDKAGAELMRFKRG